MLQPGTNALTRCGQVSVQLCRVLASSDYTRSFTDTFTDSGPSEPPNFFFQPQLRLEARVGIEREFQFILARASLPQVPNRHSDPRFSQVLLRQYAKASRFPKILPLSFHHPSIYFSIRLLELLLEVSGQVQ